MSNIVVLSGAGISVESGIPSFRGPDGLWEGHRVEDVATPDGFARNPDLVYEFYNQRRRALQEYRIQPNPAHIAVAALEHRWVGDFLLVTQNIDDLHQRAGSRQMIAMHGELLAARCLDTGRLYRWRGDLNASSPHPDFPDRTGRLRPHVVWFGEMPLQMAKIEAAARRADVFIAIGTSGLVYPAAGLVALTPQHCRRIECNTEQTGISDAFDEHRIGLSSQTVPQLVEELLAG